MKKVITDIELLKRLQPYIWETEYFLRYCSYNKDYEVVKCEWEKEIRDKYLNYWWRDTDLKTLTTDEAMDLFQEIVVITFFPKKTEENDSSKNIYRVWYSYPYNYCKEHNIEFYDFEWETQIEAISKLLDYLEKNNLLIRINYPHNFNVKWNIM